MVILHAFLSSADFFKTVHFLTPSLPPISAQYGYFDFIMVSHIISYKIITTVGIYTNFFPACLRHLVRLE